MEELVAELGSAFLCADLALTPEVREDHAAYIGNWLKVLKDDPRAIFAAAAHAHLRKKRLRLSAQQSSTSSEDSLDLLAASTIRLAGQGRCMARHP